MGIVIMHDTNVDFYFLTNIVAMGFIGGYII